MRRTENEYPPQYGHETFPELSDESVKRRLPLSARLILIVFTILAIAIVIIALGSAEAGETQYAIGLFCEEEDHVVEYLTQTKGNGRDVTQVFEEINQKWGQATCISAVEPEVMVAKQEILRRLTFGGIVYEVKRATISGLRFKNGLEDMFRKPLIRYMYTKQKII